MATIEVPVRAVAAARARLRTSRKTFFHVAMAALSVALLISAGVALAVFRYRLPDSLGNIYTFSLALGVAAAYCRWARFYRLLHSCLLVYWSCMLSFLLKFPMYLAARSGAPLQDQALARIDHSLGFDALELVHWMAHHPWLRTFFSLSYDALFPLMVLAVLIPAVRYRFQAVKELIVATSFATIAGAVIFRFVPAIGPWSVYACIPSAPQHRCQDLLLTLRSNGVHVLDLNESGIVCFPSFHALLAVVSCVALWSIKPLRIPAVFLASCVVLSTLTTGWHYLVDVIGGLLLAILSIAVARVFTAVETRLQQRSADAAS
jgi:membrane-associated phospholipid phosphatase